MFKKNEPVRVMQEGKILDGNIFSVHFGEDRETEYVVDIAGVGMFNYKPEHIKRINKDGKTPGDRSVGYNIYDGDTSEEVGFEMFEREAVGVMTERVMKERKSTFVTRMTEEVIHAGMSG